MKRQRPNLGGRPSNESRYPKGAVFDAQSFRFALTKQGMSLRALVRRLREEQGVTAHRSTVWRWTQYGLYDTGSCPSLTRLRAVEGVLGLRLLKKKPRSITRD